MNEITGFDVGCLGCRFPPTPQGCPRRPRTGCSQKPRSGYSAEAARSGYPQKPPTGCRSGYPRKGPSGHALRSRLAAAPRLQL